MVRQFPRIRVEDTRRGHLRHLVAGVREAPVDCPSEDPQKARDLRLEFPHGPEAPVEGRVRPQEVVHNAQTVQEIERKCPGQALIVYLGEFGEQQAAKHAQFEAGSTREAVRLRDPVERLQVFPCPRRVPAQRGHRVIGQDPVEPMKAGGRRTGRIEGPVVFDDPLRHHSKVRSALPAGHGPLPARGTSAWRKGLSSDSVGRLSHPESSFTRRRCRPSWNALKQTS